jgi:membrane protein
MAVVDQEARSPARRTSWLGTAVDVLWRAVKESREDGVAMMARALAFSLFLAIPATALVALGVFSLVSDESEITSLVNRAKAVMPEEAALLLQTSLERSARATGGNVAMTIVGLALAVWTTTSAAATLMEGVTRVYETPEERGFVRRRLIALLIVLALVVSAVLVVMFLILGPHIQRWLGAALDAERVTAWAWWTVQWPLLIGGLLFAFALVLYVAPASPHRGWRDVLPGAVVAVVLWLVASGAFAVYAANFGSYNKSWGTLSAVVITLVWLWLTSAALFFGAEVNAEAKRQVRRSR